jgi:hypothetical protein
MSFSRVAEQRITQSFLMGEEYQTSPIASRDSIAVYSPGRKFFDEMAADLRKSFGTDRSSSDGDAAVRIYGAMCNVTRSVAIQAGFWHQLSVLDAQRYVRWRWIRSDGMVPIERVLSRHTSPWRNALARLWWVAEICGGDEMKIKTICSSQQAIDSLADQRVAANESWVNGLCIRLKAGKWGTREVKLACRIGNQLARTRLVADMDADELADAIDQVMAELRLSALDQD